jgi:hypothetical protein
MACHVFVFLMLDRRTAASTPGRVNVLGMGGVDEFENATMVDDGGLLINACADRFLLGWKIAKTNIAVKIESMH